ncbi:MAG: hypothetical protein IJN77_00855 [Oscillospiraceae bacterium]|nr:hypothetical protein [Oscillospiraceae bacterium]
MYEIFLKVYQFVRKKNHENIGIRELSNALKKSSEEKGKYYSNPKSVSTFIRGSLWMVIICLVIGMALWTLACIFPKYVKVKAALAFLMVSFIILIILMIMDKVKNPIMIELSRGEDEGRNYIRAWQKKWGWDSVYDDFKEACSYFDGDITRTISRLKISINERENEKNKVLKKLKSLVNIAVSATVFAVTKYFDSIEASQLTSELAYLFAMGIIVVLFVVMIDYMITEIYKMLPSTRNLKEIKLAIQMFEEDNK